MTVEYHRARIEAIYLQIEALQASPILKYQTDNAGQRMAIEYRSIDELLKMIRWHESQILKINSKGGRVLAVFRRGTDG